MDNETMDECDCPEGSFEMDQEVGVRMQCLHRVLDSLHFSNLDIRETGRIIRIADELAVYVLRGTKPEAEVHTLSSLHN